MSSRKGFTAIELLVVLIVVLVLVGMAVPALVGAMHKGSVNDAANAILRVSSQARQFARTRSLPSGPGVAVGYYGLTVGCDNGQTYVALTYGPDATPATVLMQPGGAKPVSKLLLNRNVIAYTGTKYDPDAATPVATGDSFGWLYQYRTGYPIVTASTTAKNMNIGVDPEHPSPAGPEVPRAQFPNNLRHLSFRTADGRYRTAVAVYQIGLANVQDF